MNIFTINLSDITIPPTRQRTDKDDKYIDQLSESIRMIGQINPIILDETNTLIAGWCRIKAFELLGRTEIYARRWEDLDQYEKELIEFEENVRRKNLSYNEQLLAELALHERFQQYHGVQKSPFYGHVSKGRPKWRVEDMANFMGFSIGKMSERLKLAQEIRRNPEMGDFKTESQARHAMERKQAQAIRTVLAAVKVSEQKETTPSNEPKPLFETYHHGDITLINADAKLVIPTLPDDSISCLITDPPWNVLFDESFGTDTKIGLELTHETLRLLYPKLQSGSLCVMYCATRHLITGKIYELVQSCGYAIYPTIHIWYKPHSAGSSIPYRELKNDYEPALLFSKGLGRDFHSPMWAVISGLVEGKRYHTAQKCTDVLKQLIQNFTVENELVIDPFMGSGQTMLACRALKRRGLGIEKEPDHYHTAIYLMEEPHV
ncbi:MAG: DNA methyltransferase [Candidatus Paceibacterota bacterium]